MIATLYINEVKAYKFNRGYFTGETSSIPLGTNSPELKGELVRFYGDTRQDVIEQVIMILRSKGLHGRLRIA